MGAAVFFGCAGIAFGPAAALVLLTVAAEPLRVIVLVAGAFFWLLSLLAASLLWFVAVQLSGREDAALLLLGAAAAVLLQELCRFACFKILKSRLLSPLAGPWLSLLLGVGRSSCSLSGGAGRRMKGWRPSARTGSPRCPCDRWLTCLGSPLASSVASSPSATSWQTLPGQALSASTGTPLTTSSPLVRPGPMARRRRRRRKAPALRLRVCSHSLPHHGPDLPEPVLRGHLGPHLHPHALHRPLGLWHRWRLLPQCPQVPLL
ncbi:gamma-secretase subunit APH-1A isoform X5 [Prinia subflava]|uniref:gamma-secretase subunit APH-1A isoform X5 n=1 Tax=Prinia subflava TaxID=208062 RepID=UPI002FE0A86A